MGDQPFLPCSSPFATYLDIAKGLIYDVSKETGGNARCTETVGFHSEQRNKGDFKAINISV